MKTKWILLMLAVVLGIGSIVISADAQKGSLRSQLLANEGKTFRGTDDPEFVSYDLVLRDFVSKRIQKRYGETFDPKNFSGFELLEIEAFLKCKKPNEPVEPYLEKFRKPR